MKNRLLPIFLAISLVAGLIFIFKYFTSKTCNLPAPDSLTVVDRDNTMARLRWTSVENAQSYRIVVKDSLSGVVVTDTTNASGLDSVLLVNNLVDTNTYIAEVAAVCKKNPKPSSNTIQTLINPDTNLIAGDIVVMVTDAGQFGGVLSNCTSCTGIWSDFDSFSPPNNGSFVSGDRLIYEFSYAEDTTTRYFKLAFERNKGEIYARECPTETSRLSAGHTYTHNGRKVAPLIIDMGDGEPISILFHSSRGGTDDYANRDKIVEDPYCPASCTTIRYRQCIGF